MSLSPLMLRFINLQYLSLFVCPLCRLATSSFPMNTSFKRIAAMEVDILV